MLQRRLDFCSHDNAIQCARNGSASPCTRKRLLCHLCYFSKSFRIWSTKRAFSNDPNSKLAYSRVYVFLLLLSLFCPHRNTRSLLLRLFALCVCARFILLLPFLFLFLFIKLFDGILSGHRFVYSFIYLLFCFNSSPSRQFSLLT